MPIPRLRIDDLSLLVIDLQERIMPSMAERERVCLHATLLLRMANELGIPALLTEHCVQKMGRTVPDVALAVPNPAARVEKSTFSAALDLVVDQFRRWRRSTVLIAGIEAHVCVLQTVLDLQDSGFQCFVVTDAITSGQRDQVAPALERMRAAGALPTGVVSAMYELMGDANHPSFRACLELAKSVRV